MPERLWLELSKCFKIKKVRGAVELTSGTRGEFYFFYTRLWTWCSCRSAGCVGRFRMCWGTGCIWLFTNRAFVQSMNSMGTIGRHASANMGVSDSSLSRCRAYLAHWSPSAHLFLNQPILGFFQSLHVEVLRVQLRRESVRTWSPKFNVDFYFRTFCRPHCLSFCHESHPFSDQRVVLPAFRDDIWTLRQGSFTSQLPLSIPHDLQCPTKMPTILTRNKFSLIL